MFCKPITVKCKTAVYGILSRKEKLKYLTCEHFFTGFWNFPRIFPCEPGGRKAIVSNQSKTILGYFILLPQNCRWECSPSKYHKSLCIEHFETWAPPSWFACAPLLASTPTYHHTLEWTLWGLCHFWPTIRLVFDDHYLPTCKKNIKKGQINLHL